ncbi:MAG: MoaD/ThiS family protein [Puia sp.]|nr:MoaD/ThiS family protein [Puia sp.]
MKVQVFAMLKDHFDKEFEVSGGVSDLEALRSRLRDMNPASSALLDSCRFAVNDEFIDNDFKLQENDIVIILPPSSGG